MYIQPSGLQRSEFLPEASGLKVRRALVEPEARMTLDEPEGSG